MGGPYASFIRVCELLYCQMFFEANLPLSFPRWYEQPVDRSQRHQNLPGKLELQTFFGQLQSIVVIPIPKSKEPKTKEPQMFVLRLFDLSWIVSYSRGLGARSYAWARPILIEAGAEIHTRGHLLTADWTARYVSFLPIFWRC